MPSNNRIIISAAGSGKTTRLVNEAISKPKLSIAILTYTINNLTEIRKIFYKLHGSIPSNVTILSWFTFLLHECVRPYQNFICDKHRIESIFFTNRRSSIFIPKTNYEKYFFNGHDIYSDKISEFAILCNQKSNGLVINRLSDIYDEIYIDEIQDMAGYDLDLIELLLKSNIVLLLVGDNRQATYSTNSSAKNSKYVGYNINILFSIWEKNGLCQREYFTENYRCNQEICDLADGLYPEMPKTNSQNSTTTSHDGIFIVPDNLINDYVKKYSPMLLRYDRNTNCNDSFALNFGESKGLTFDRVMIFPNKPIKDFITTGENKYILKSRAKLYVAITRSRFSVAFAYSGKWNSKRFIDFSTI